MGKVICICGKICSGKSRYASNLCRQGRGVLLSVDEVMLSVFGLYAGEKHDEYTEGVKKYLLQKAMELVNMDIDVLLDWGFWSRESRRQIRDFFESRKIECEIHYLKVAEDVWKKRIEKRNHDVKEGTAQAYIIDKNLVDKFMEMFQEPEDKEIDKTIEY